MLKKNTFFINNIFNKSIFFLCVLFFVLFIFAKASSVSVSSLTDGLGNNLLADDGPYNLSSIVASGTTNVSEELPIAAVLSGPEGINVLDETLTDSSGNWTLDNSSNPLSFAPTGENDLWIGQYFNTHAIEKETWRDMATDGNGNFVAVAKNKKYAYSNDYGKTWTAAINLSDEKLLDIFYDTNLNLFMASGFANSGGARILTSSDGSTWTIYDSQTLNSQFDDSEFNKLIYDGAGVYVAVSDNSKIMYSSDITSSWNYATQIAADIHLYSLTHDGVNFWAIGGGGTIIKSSDGITWNSVPQSVTTDNIYGIINYGTDKLMAYGAGGMIMKSEDNGASWTDLSANVPTDLQDNFFSESVYHNGVIYITGGNGTFIFSEDEGLTWDEKYSNPDDGSFYGLTLDGDKIYAILFKEEVKVLDLVPSFSDYSVTITDIPQDISQPDGSVNLIDSSDNGASNTDNLTNDPRPIVEVGPCQEATSKLVLYAIGTTFNNDKYYELGRSSCLDTSSNLEITPTYDLQAGNGEVYNFKYSEVSQTNVETELSSTSLDITIDLNTPSQVKIDLAQGASFVDSVSFSLSNLEIGATYEYVIDESPISSSNPLSFSATTSSESVSLDNVDISSLNDGLLVVYANSTDKAGNKNSNNQAYFQKASVPINIPTFEVLTSTNSVKTSDFETNIKPGDSYTLGTIQNIVLDSRSSSTSDIKIKLGGVEVSAIDTSSENIYKIFYTVEDLNFLNISKTITETLTIADDTQGPTFEVLTSFGDIKTSDFETKIYSGYDYQTGSIQNISDESGANGGVTIGDIGTDPGIYTVEYKVTDSSTSANSSSIVETVYVYHEEIFLGLTLTTSKNKIFSDTFLYGAENFSDDGMYFYVILDSNLVGYQLTTAYDISSLDLNLKTTIINLSTEITFSEPEKLTIVNYDDDGDGTDDRAIIFIADPDKNRLFRIETNKPVEELTNLDSHLISVDEIIIIKNNSFFNSLVSVDFSEDGNIMFLLDSQTNTLYKFNLKSPYNLENLNFSNPDEQINVGFDNGATLKDFIFINNGHTLVFVDSGAYLRRYDFKYPYVLESSIVSDNNKILDKFSTHYFDVDSYTLVGGVHDEDNLFLLRSKKPTFKNSYLYFREYSIQYDTTNFPLPTRPSLNETTDINLKDNITNIEKPIVDGECTDGNNVKIYLNDSLAGSSTCSSGAFSIPSSVSLEEGDNEIVFTETINGNEGEKSNILWVNYDITKPDIDLEEDIFLSGNSELLIDIKEYPTIEGPGLSDGCKNSGNQNYVNIFINDVFAGSGTCFSEKGEFNFSVTSTEPLVEGLNKIDYTVYFLGTETDGQESLWVYYDPLSTTAQTDDLFESSDDTVKLNIQDENNYINLYDFSTLEDCSDIVDYNYHIYNGVEEKVTNPDNQSFYYVCLKSEDLAGNISYLKTSSPISMSLDNDDDGSSDYEEFTLSMINFSDEDIDNDGTKDSHQKNFVGRVNSRNKEPMFIRINDSSSCKIIKDFDYIDDPTATSDSFRFPLDLFYFELECENRRDSAEITIYFDKVYDTTNWLFRKMKQDGSFVSSIDGMVNYATATLKNNKEVTTITYTVEDGGVYDYDETIDKKIIDPIGVTISDDVYGCNDVSAENYDPFSNLNDGSCIYSNPIYGCTSSSALNYDGSANTDDGSCTYTGTSSGGGGGGGSSYDIETDSPSNISSNSAILDGKVKDEDDWEIYFILSKTDSRPSCSDESDEEDKYTVYTLDGKYNENEDFSYQVDNLDSDTEYYYRACGIDSDGDIENGDSKKSFTTLTYIEAEVIYEEEEEDQKEALRGQLIILMTKLVSLLEEKLKFLN